MQTRFYRREPRHACAWREARILSFLLFLGLATGASAQRSGVPRAAAGQSPTGVSIQDVCAAGVPREAQGNAFAWSPDGGAIAYFKPLTTGSFGLHLELDLVSASGGDRSILLTGPQIDRLFPPTTSADGTEKIPPPRESTGFEWSPDGRGILLHSDRSLVWLDRQTLETRTLISGKETVADVQVSPNSRWAAFVRDHNLWVVSMSGGHVRAVTQGGVWALRKGELDWMYPAELATRHGYSWSPDSSHIAYLVFDLKSVATYTPPFADEDDPGQTIDYPTPGKKNPFVRAYVASAQEKTSAPVLIDTGSVKDVYLPRMQWLPDGKRLAIERLNRPQNQLDLLIADVRTGASRVLLTEKDSYWINLTDILYFLKSAPQFLWSSERSGFRHLYLYDLNGKLIKQVTTGEWEVTSLDAVNEGQRKIYYTSTEKSSLERHLYSTGFDGGAANRISGESGTHEATFRADASAFVDRFSTATKPWTETVYRINDDSGVATEAKALGRSLITKSFSLDETPGSGKTPGLLPAEFLTVKSHDGIEMNARMVRPRPFAADKKYPAIVYVYGGPARQSARDAWDGDVSMWQQMLAQNGYIVFTVDNRGTSGRGHAFEEYIHLRFAGQEMTDQRDAVHFLQSLPYVDPARVGIWGRGFGGALTVSAMLHPPVLFKAGFAVAPVVDWMRYDSAFAERYLGDPVSNQDGYLSSSPLDEWQRYKGPMLIGQGTADLEVHPDQSMELQDDLVERRKYVEISLFPGQGHAISGAASCAVLYQRATDFFAKSL